MTMCTLVLKYIETTSNWEARVKVAEDQALRAKHEHDEATRKEAKLKEQMASWLIDKDDALVKQCARAMDVLSQLDHYEV